MVARSVLMFAALLSIAGVAAAKPHPPVDQNEFPAAYVPPGDTMFKEYCSACHGSDARGHGPVASMLKVPPPDLTLLAKRHGGKFPYEYVSSILRFGPGVSAHGAADMPTWGPIFSFLDNYNERSVQQRIKNLAGYLASLQDMGIAENHSSGSGDRSASAGL